MPVNPVFPTGLSAVAQCCLMAIFAVALPCHWFFFSIYGCQTSAVDKLARLVELRGGGVHFDYC